MNVKVTAPCSSTEGRLALIYSGKKEKALRIFVLQDGMKMKGLISVTTYFISLVLGLECLTLFCFLVTHRPEKVLKNDFQVFPQSIDNLLNAKSKLSFLPVQYG